MKTEITGTKCPQRGNRIKPAVGEITGVKTNKNPFLPGTRLFGFFSAFLGKKERVATYKQIVDAYISTQKKLNLEVEPIPAIERDLTNHVSAWQRDLEGNRGLHIKVEVVKDAPKGLKREVQFKLVGIKKDSPYAERAKEMGWDLV